MNKTQNPNSVNGLWLDDIILDAKRYRYLRQTAFRSHTGEGNGRRYSVELHFVAPQQNQWPDQNAFCDFDLAVDGSMSAKDKVSHPTDETEGAAKLAAPSCPAFVWKFDDAPQELRGLSTNGGDEDWLVELPPRCEYYGIPNWVEVMDAVYEPARYNHPTKPGWKVIIASHA